MFVFHVIQISASKVTVLPTCTFPSKIDQEPAKDLQGLSLLFHHFPCVHVCGDAVAHVWLKWNKVPKQQITCCTLGQLSSHKTTISVIRQAPVSVQEQQQRPQWVFGT